MQLEGQSVIVTGAAGRLGAATVEALAAEGAAVLAVDIALDRVEELCDRVRSTGARVEAVQADVSVEHEVKTAISAATDTFGGLDAIFNNAGLVGLEHNVGLLELTTEVWDRTMAVNLRSVMLCCKYALPALIARGGGSIINTSSDASLAGDIENYAYAASKAGVNTLTRYVAAGYGKQNVRCNAIAPGIHLDSSYLASLDEGRQAFYARLEDHCLLPRLGTSTDIANAVVFLASEASAYITGQVIQVDGGLMGHVPHLADVRRAGAS